MANTEWVKMICVDCKTEFEGESIPGPYKRCPKCKFKFKKEWNNLSRDERDKRIAEALKLAALGEQS